MYMLHCIVDEKGLKLYGQFQAVLASNISTIIQILT
jgi:hypothetical protein